LRISPAALAAVDKRAEESDRTRAEMLRVMLTYAEKRMPRETK
jgi:hypothetical protein